MKVIYDKKAQRIDLISDTLKFCVAFITNDEVFFDCSTIKLEIATKLFQRWHQIERDEPEFIARALNDAVDDCLYVQVRVNDHRVNRIKMYDGEDAYIRLSICLGLTDKVIDSRLHMNDITINHNITEDRLEYFIDDKLKGWLPIIRKEITS